MREFKKRLGQLLLISILILIVSIFWSRSVGLFGLRIIESNEIVETVTKCPSMNELNTPYQYNSKDSPLLYLAYLHDIYKKLSQNSKEAEGENPSLIANYIANNKRISPYNQTVFYVCQLQYAGIAARIVKVVKTPLRSQHLLLAEYKENGSWKVVNVTRGIGYSLKNKQVSTLQIIKAFYNTSYQDLISIKYNFNTNKVETVSEGISDLHKAHFALYYEQISYSFFNKLPLIRAILGPRVSIDSNSFDGHLEDLMLYKLIYNVIYIYLPAVVVILSAMLCFTWFSDSRKKFYNRRFQG